MHQSAGDVTAMGSGDTQTIPVCLVRQSRNLEKEEHEQIAVCRINLMVRSCSLELQQSFKAVDWCIVHHSFDLEVSVLLDACARWARLCILDGRSVHLHQCNIEGMMTVCRTGTDCMHVLYYTMGMGQKQQH